MKPAEPYEPTEADKKYYEEHNVRQAFVHCSGTGFSKVHDVDGRLWIHLCETIDALGAQLARTRGVPAQWGRADIIYDILRGCQGNGVGQAVLRAIYRE